MAVDLRFSKPQITTPPIALRFGEVDVTPCEITVGIEFPGLIVEVVLDTTSLLFIADVQFPALEVNVNLQWDTATSRPLTADTGTSWQIAQETRIGREDRTNELDKIQPSNTGVWGEGRDLYSDDKRVLSSGATQRLPRGYEGRFENARKLSEHWVEFQTDHGVQAQLGRSTGWKEGLDIRQWVQALYQEMDHSRRPQLIARWQAGQKFRQSWDGRWKGKGLHVPQSWVVPWGAAIRPPAGTSPENIPPGPVVPPSECYDPSQPVHLLFKGTYLRNGNLRFVCEAALGPPPLYAIPVRKVYLVINDIQFKRVSDNTPIKILAGNVTIDSNSWAWGFSANLPYTELSKIEPTGLGPVEVELSLNGFLWRFLIEDYSFGQRFNNSTLSVRGRSVTAYLDEPYASKRSLVQNDSILSRQLAENELARPELTGVFSLDWDLVDPLGWVVPSASWSYQDLTPLQAIKNIVESAGGYVNSYPASHQLAIRSLYPESPWNWDAAVADVSVPTSIILGQTLEWGEKPEYNRVFVSGERTGIVAQVTRTGTAGDFVAPMIVHPLLTDDPVNRHRGRVELSKGGKQAQVTVELPLSGLTTLFTPGKLVEFTGGGFKAMTRGLTVDFSLDSDASKIRQRSVMERHY